MAITIQSLPPQEIEKESFRIIESELGPHEFTPQQFPIVQRVIHATGDFTFASEIRFSPAAIEHGLAQLKAGKNILTDVNMVASGINKKALQDFGTQVICKVADGAVAKKAAETGKTRSEVAIEEGIREDIGIIAIGNAPTALLKVLELYKNVAHDFCPLIIGVPVGFVNAAESKLLLNATTMPFITALGRKGGSPVAAAIVNGLSRLLRA